MQILFSLVQPNQLPHKNVVKQKNIVIVQRRLKSVKTRVIAKLLAAKVLVRCGVNYDVKDNFSIGFSNALALIDHVMDCDGVSKVKHKRNSHEGLVHCMVCKHVGVIADNCNSQQL